MDETFRGALQSDPSEEEDSEDDVGEEGGEVDDLARAGDALHQDEIDEDPGGDETENVPVLQSSNIVWKRGKSVIIIVCQPSYQSCWWSPAPS